MFKTGTVLKGLPGDNPLGFLAAIGLQEISAGGDLAMSMWWTDTPVPYAVIDKNITCQKLAMAADKTLARWLSSPAVDPPSTKFGNAAKTAKFDADGIREYLKICEGDIAQGFSSALVAEDCLARTKAEAKPTEFYFTAGNQKFLQIVRNLLLGTSGQQISQTIVDKWKYQDNAKQKSLMWDVRDDRQYALSPIDPSNMAKTTNVAIEALAAIGLSRFPVFPGNNWIQTTGCQGKWGGASFSWGVWDIPSPYASTGYLVSHITEENIRYYEGWGVFRTFKAPISRNEQGGYGTFLPARTTWNR